MTRTVTDANDPRLRDQADTAPARQREAYLVLSEDVRKAPVQPVRRTFYHRACETKTVMRQDMAESLACDPTIYKALYCCACSQHFVLSAFRWPDGSDIVQARRG